MSIRVGTRGSLLATTQAGTIRDQLPDAELTIITTPGDRSQAPVERIGVGVFTQALREAMAEGQCDVAVHSFKDLPSAPDPRFALVVPKRADCRDVLIARDGMTLDQLPAGAKVGTSAPRRVAQLRLLRPDLEIVPLRGNIDTRMGKVLTTRELDAVILAAAGLERVGRLEQATEIFDPAVFLPAPAQGALAVEVPVEQAELIAHLACPEATVETIAERQILITMEAGCTAPIAAHATVSGEQVHLRAGYFGEQAFVVEGQAPVADAKQLGEKLATQLLGFL